MDAMLAEAQNLSSLAKTFQAEGYVVARSLFTRDECDHFAKYFTDMVERGGDGWSETVVDPNDPDPLRRYPRLLQPHRGDSVAFGYMIDPRIREHLTALAGAEPYAVQTMVYFKPPGARGQNLHQDNMYLLAKPGTCLAAWMALDDIDEENGCMVVAPGTQDLPVMCQVERPGLSQEQWGDVETPLPPGTGTVPIVMSKGDVMFFNGSLIHGSFRNRSENRFRRTLIGHYIAAESQQVATYYFPVFRMDGSRLDGEIAVSETGGPCGTYGEDGVELSGQFKAWESAH